MSRMLLVAGPGALIPVGYMRAGCLSKKSIGTGGSVIDGRVQVRAFSSYSGHRLLTACAPSISYRIGLFGTAANPTLQEDSESAGDQGVGNHGESSRSFPSHRLPNVSDPRICDHQVLFEWIHHFNSESGGYPSNVTLFGGSTGAADILCLMRTKRSHLFHRAILTAPWNSWP